MLSDDEIDRITDVQWVANNHKPIYAAHRAYARAIEAALAAAPQGEPVAFHELLREAEAEVRAKPVWKRYIDGTPLANDVPVWMAVFAQHHARTAAPPAPAAQPSEWADHVEQRIRSWRNSRINSDGDRLALDDYLSDSDIDNLVDYVCGDAESSRSHRLYKTGDPDAPDAVRDRNGDVVLGMCKVCGKAEVELSEPCAAQPSAEPSYTLQQIADACVYAEIPDSKFESVSIALQDAQPSVEPTDTQRLDFIASNARSDPKMNGQNVWWPTNFKHALRGPTFRAAIDAAMKGER